MLIIAPVMALFASVQTRNDCVGASAKYVTLLCQMVLV